jgi:hypothetical protein
MSMTMLGRFACASAGAGRPIPESATTETPAASAAALPTLLSFVVPHRCSPEEIDCTVMKTTPGPFQIQDIADD